MKTQIFYAVARGLRLAKNAALNGGYSHNTVEPVIESAADYLAAELDLGADQLKDDIFERE